MAKRCLCDIYIRENQKDLLYKTLTEAYEAEPFNDKLYEKLSNET
jgi:hypothetical protein